MPLKGRKTDQQGSSSPFLRKRILVKRSSGSLDEDSFVQLDKESPNSSGDNEDTKEDKPAPYKNPRNTDWTKHSEKELYEMQLKNLEQQLESAVIARSSLELEIKKYEGMYDAKQMKGDLESKRQANTDLRERCRHLEDQLFRTRCSDTAKKDETDQPSTAGMARRVLGEENREPPGTFSLENYNIWKNWSVDKFLTVLADFQDDLESDNDEPDMEEEQLSVKKLKANINRFKAAYAPIVSYIKAIGMLLSWKSAPATFLALFIYMYAVVTGWLIPLFLGLFIWVLFSTFLIASGWKIEFYLLSYPEEAPDEDKETMSISDKYHLAVHIARKIQNVLGSLSDVLEKLYNLIYWGNPHTTWKLMRALLFGFVVSVILPAGYLLSVVAFVVGCKLFVLDTIFKKFPRVKAKYDTAHNMFQSLPTHIQLENKEVEEKEKFELVTPAIVDTSPNNDGNGDFFRNFCEAFLLPSSEYPMSGWEDGKRCTLINKEKSFTMAFRQGKLYLTPSYICFGRLRRLHHDKNVKIHLSEVESISKAKPFQLIPGQGMSVEIKLKNDTKPYMFGAIINRDEVHTALAIGLSTFIDRERNGNGAKTGNGTKKDGKGVKKSGKDETDVGRGESFSGQDLPGVGRGPGDPPSESVLFT